MEEEDGSRIYELAPPENEGSQAISNLLRDEALEEIMVNGPDRPVMVVHRYYGTCKTNVVLSSREIREFVELVAENTGTPLDSCILDATLPDGSRMNAALPPVASNGPVVTIRKFRSRVLTPLDLVAQGVFPPELGGFLWCCIEGFSRRPCNVLFIGSAGSGKTTLLNALSFFVPSRERIVTIEDTLELVLPHENLVRLEASHRSGATMDDLVRAALRMRPDRIIVGEVRGSEAVTIFSAMNTGQRGCMGTLHANSTREAIERITNPPMSVPPAMIRALDMLVKIEKIESSNGTIERRVTEVVEVSGMDGDRPLLNRIFVFDPRRDVAVSTGVPSVMKERICQEAGISGNVFDERARERARVLEENAGTVSDPKTIKRLFDKN